MSCGPSEKLKALADQVDALDDSQTIVGNQTEQVAKKKRETVVESVTESFGKHTTTVDKSTFRQSVGNIVEVTGGDLMFGAAGKSEFGSAGDQKFKTEANQTIEVATNQTKTVGGNVDNDITGNLDIDAAQIDLN